MKIINDFSLYNDHTLHNDLYDVCDLCSKRRVEHMADYMVYGDYYGYEDDLETCVKCELSTRRERMVEDIKWRFRKGKSFYERTDYYCEECWDKQWGTK